MSESEGAVKVLFAPTSWIHCLPSLLSWSGVRTGLTTSSFFNHQGPLQ